MLLHLVKDSLFRRRRRVAITTLALLLGTAMVCGLLAVALDIEAKVGRELRSYGANITLAPSSGAIPVEAGGIPVGEIRQKSYLEEDQLSRLKTIFWKNNITAFAPFLYGNVSTDAGTVMLAGTWFRHDVDTGSDEPFQTGVRDTSPWWQVDGDWPARPGEVLVGRELAERRGIAVGDKTILRSGEQSAEYRVSGILATGSYEDNQVLVDLPEAQRLLGLPGKVERVQVSALTKPPDELARRAQALGDPHELPADEYEKWYCSPYIDAITFQIEEAIPAGSAKAVRQVAEAEGSFLAKMKLLFALIAGACVLASSLGVTATMSATVMERRSEIGLMRALGAESSHIAVQFLLEAAFSGVAAGIGGFGLGALLSLVIGREVFGAAAGFNPVILPIALCISLGIAMVGSALPVRRATRIDPIRALKS